MASLRRASQKVLYERLLEEKDKHILILSDQIDYLRLQVGMQTASRLRAVNPTKQDARTLQDAPYLSEDEEDVRDMLESGLITEAQIPDVLDGLGFASNEVFHS